MQPNALEQHGCALDGLVGELIHELMQVSFGHGVSVHPAETPVPGSVQAGN